MNLIFDLDNTLYDQFKVFNEAFIEVIKKEDLSKKIYLDSRKYSEEIFEDFINKKITENEMQIYRLQKAFTKNNLEISKLKIEKLQHKYKEKQYNMKLSQSMKTLLEYCNKKNITIGIITNGKSFHQSKKIQSLNLHSWFEKDNIFISDDLGVHKPSIGIFKYVLKKMSLDRNSTYYIGDSIENDIIPANKLGLKTIFMNRHKYSFLDINKLIDYNVQNDTELYKLVKKLET